MNFVNYVDYFLFFMLIVKTVFLVSAIGHVITIRSVNPKIQQHELLMRKISDTSEMIFVFGMSLFLVYYFFPNKKNFIINKETAILLFAYGFVMLIGAVKKYHFPTPHLLDKKKEGSTSTTASTTTSTSTTSR